MKPDYMTSFKEWYAESGYTYELDVVEEAFSPEAIPDKGKTKAELFLGRMQPIHKGHLNIINKMKNPIIVLVKGKESSKDKERNPLSAEVQSKLLKKAAPGARVIIAKAGYLPEIFSDLREANRIEITKVFAGADRIAGYKRQIDSVNKKIDPIRAFDVEFVETKRFTSATKVREVIRSGDEKEFKKLMPKELHDEFDNLRKLLEIT